jgi:hypothetical protein
MRNLEKIALKKKETKNKIFNLKKEIVKIKLSQTISLDETQQKKYDSWNEMIEKTPTFFKPYKNEKEFLIKQKEIELNFEKMNYKSLICKEKGHKEEVMSTGNLGTYVNCKRCGTGYTRPMNVKESKSFYEFMKTPFNI